jgi:hypothetical protein
MLDGRETAHVQHTAQVPVTHFADSFSSSHRNAAGMFPGCQAGKGNKLPVIADLFEALGVNNQ